MVRQSKESNSTSRESWHAFREMMFSKISFHFNKQFGYRVGNILESKNLVEYIVTDARYYHDLIWIIQKLVDEELIEPGNYYSKLRNLPSELVRRKTTKNKWLSNN